MNVWACAAVAVMTGWAAWTDVRRMIIPNRLTHSFALAGLLYQTVAGGWTGLFAGCAGLLTGAIPLITLYAFKGIGAGDVKWFAAFGTWAGVGPTLDVLVRAVLTAGAIAGVLLLWRVPPFRRLAASVPWPWGPHPAAGSGVRFPFMLAVVPAVFFELIRAFRALQGEVDGGAFSGVV
jgi:Flp pilus assembly protein protease CpaA